MIRALALSAAAVLIAAPAVAQESRTVVLKERLVTEDAVVTLSDLFDVDGEAAAALLAGAPEPGATLSLDPAFVRETAARAGLAWANAGGEQRLTVERAAREVSLSEVAALVEETLFMDTGTVHQVEISGGRRALAAPLDA
ncbi:MAG: hypothetical protein ACOC0V_04990, partial [Oceanicaulis sp.]